jgi:DMSO/TMAO reductase YedYZ molybdopterin-dependent catalytic subunit
LRRDRVSVETAAMTTDGISVEELQLAARNHGMPLELLREDVTPVGLHYLLIHYDVPGVDAGAWRLSVDGRVAQRLSLSLEELRSLPDHEVVTTMECAGNGRARLAPRPVSQPWLLEAVGTGRWRGVRLRDVLGAAAPGDDAVEVLFTGLDRGIENGEEQAFARSLSVADAAGDDVLLAYELNGVPLPPQHGFPLRLVVPGWYGMTNVKWLERITLLDAPFTGYQQARGYRLRQTDDEPGEALTRIAPRALMVPPGIPDFMTRVRSVRAGRHTLEGRAWSGHAPIAGVEVSDDGGATWQRATLDPPALGPWAWRRWTCEWTAEPGEHTLCCRARDESGREQPTSPTWNLGGYANNEVQRVQTTVV